MPRTDLERLLMLPLCANNVVRPAFLWEPERRDTGHRGACLCDHPQ